VNLHWKQQAVTVTYTITPVHDVTFSLEPMVTLRDFHAMRYNQQDHGLAARVEGDVLHVGSREAQAVIQSPGASVILNHGRENWWYSIFYTQDHDRGQEDHEDHYVPARFEHTLAGGREHVITLTAALGNEPVAPQRDNAGRDQHLSGVVKALKKLEDISPTLPAMLAISSDDFVVDRVIKGKKLSTILAGFPWFSDWGRDTFIALPGLMLTTGRHDEARDVLHTFAQSIRDGLVPNRFDDYNADDVHYNTVDASLWFIDAAMHYYKATNDNASWHQWLAPACMQIIDAYLKGTRYDIHMTGDGLISAGNPQTQLTWMDAACNGVVFTPRQGKAVEINALWYHVLMGMSELVASSHGAAAEHYTRLASRTARSFLKVFWDEKQGCLRDHIWIDEQGNEHVDGSIRPNQVIAASVAHSPLPKTKCKVMLETVEKKLLTPYGLRTLPEEDAKYHPHYQGPVFQRDEAYHQGTIWPWLIGPYAEAVLRVNNFSPKSRAQAREILTPLIEFMQGPGVGQLYEIHEAQPPHRPVGCSAQAWSVAQVMRVLSLL